MGNQHHGWRLLFGALTVLICWLFSETFGQAWELPEKVPGDFEGRWYGVHCPKVPKKKMVGLVDGEEAFPNQTIIDSWGYKARPIEEIKNLLPEMYYSICSNPDAWGNIRINETAYIPVEQWPGDHRKRIKDATEKNLGTARLDEKGHIKSYENGLPFPGSTTGIEIAWNFVYARNGGDEFLTRLYTAVVDKKGRTRYMVGEAAGLSWKGRLRGKHVPRIEPNPNNYEGFSSIGFKSPYDMKGLVGATHRYDSADKEDDQWLYLPQVRRVRRMSTAQRWDKCPGGVDITYDAVMGFSGKPTNYEWKYLGRKELLCCHNAKAQLQEIKGKAGGSICDQWYQRVNCVLLEYSPKIISSISRAVMVLDPELYCAYYVEFFDTRGRPYLFYAHAFVVSNDGYIGPCGFFVSDVQRIHSSHNYGYEVFLDGDSEDIKPSYFQMNKLRKSFPSR